MQCFTSELFTLRTGQRAPAEVLNSHASSASSWHIHTQPGVVQQAHAQPEVQPAVQPRQSNVHPGGCLDALQFRETDFQDRFPGHKSDSWH